MRAILRTRTTRLPVVSKPMVNSLCTAASPTAVMNTKPLANWMFGLSAMVVGMVTVGGVTRLTRSGLSMTDWKLQGSLPPMNEEEWEKEFARYKTFPEGQQRKGMDLSEFKFIYFWEYSHRMMGRTIGLAFALPFTYFASRRMIPKALYPRLGALFALGGGQGLIGWWMVKSGLEMDPEQKKEIRVSPYRLATHLTMAFTTYSLLVWTGFELNQPKNMYNTAVASARTVAETAVKFKPIEMARAIKTRRAAAIATAVVATTAFSGAFVAGNDAGRAYNTFPKMGDEWVPTGIYDMQPLWRNIFENTPCVQFDHRVMALTSVGAITAIFLTAYPTGPKSVTLRRSAPELVQKALTAVGHMTAVQVGLGVSTLLLYVPTELAAMHQVGALALLTLLLRLNHVLGYTKIDTAGETARSLPMVDPSVVGNTSYTPLVGSGGSGGASTSRAAFSTLVDKKPIYRNSGKNSVTASNLYTLAGVANIQKKAFSTARANFDAYAMSASVQQQRSTNVAPCLRLLTDI